MTLRVDDVLSGRDGAKGVRAALRSSPMRRHVRHSVVGLTGPVSLGQCRLRRSKFKPNHKLSAWFDAAAGRAASRRSIAVTWWADDGAPLACTIDEEALEEEAEGRGLRAPFLRLTTAAPDMRMRVTISPLDAAFPQLVRFSDPEFVATLIGDRHPPLVTTVRYRPGQRHVLSYRSAHGGEPLFAKLYRDDTGARGHRIATAVGDLIAEGSPGLSVARPSAYLDGDDRVLLVPWVAGVPLSAHVRASASVAGAHLHKAGALLRRLHEAPSAISDVVGGYGVEDELDASTRASSAIGQLMPAVGGTVQGIIDRTRETLRALPPEWPCLLHGDYKSDHLLVGRSCLTLIDFDRAARGDPALDLAKFLADVRWWTGSRRTASTESAQAAFLRGYGPPSAERLARARSLEPLFLVKLAARRVPIHEPGWEARTTALVEQAAWLSRQRTPKVCA